VVFSLLGRYAVFPEERRPQLDLGGSLKPGKARIPLKKRTWHLESVKYVCVCVWGGGNAFKSPSDTMYARFDFRVR